MLSKTADDMPIVFLIDRFPRAFKIWSELECWAVLTHATKVVHVEHDLKMVLFGFSPEKLSTISEKKVKAVTETSDNARFDEIDKRLAALEARANPITNPKQSEDETEEPETTEDDTEEDDPRSESEEE